MQNKPTTLTPSLKTVEDFITEGHTPMMAQYHVTKEAYPDCLLFYRMGDFYEMFYEDAIKAAEALDITLTKRGKNQGDDIPMCGVPWHAHENYLAKLIRAGFKVAICEQTETPEEAKKRGGYKALVRRDVVRVVTSGTLTEEQLLQASENNFLACIHIEQDVAALSWMELSTGTFQTQSVPADDILNVLETIRPSESILSEDTQQKIKLLKSHTPLQTNITLINKNFFELQSCKQCLDSFFHEDPYQKISNFSRHELKAAGALLAYVQRTQLNNIPHISLPVSVTETSYMLIDGATRRNLEITHTLAGERKGSLLHTIDRTMTGAGGRLLQTWLSAPLNDLESIHARQALVTLFAEAHFLRTDVRTAFRSCPDMERALARLTANRGGPRDLLMIRQGLALTEELTRLLTKHDAALLHPLINTLTLSDTAGTFLNTIQNALLEEPPALLRDGNFIKPGYDPILDKFKNLKKGNRENMAVLQKKYRDMTGIDRLKISFNNVLGYFIEVPSKNGEALLNFSANEPTANPFIHRQTMASAVRFATSELADLERDLAQAEERALAIELEHFQTFIAQIAHIAEDIRTYARTLAQIDVLTALAELAMQENYTCPKIDNSRTFDVRGARHPVVEKAVKEKKETFVPNDCLLIEDQNLWLLTGPNMAGKSTFLRQNALIAILAQIGSYVPAQSAHIGCIDQVFSRVGASDDLARGHSTFMVEMVETASILNRATKNSLVILDEIGRGTATFDGLSIAWACVEHLHNSNQCRALFATHYHELTQLTAQLPRLTCYSMQVKEWKGEIIFMHSVQKGAADRSYGIHVAKLAGLPSSVIQRAGQILKLLESKDRTSKLIDICESLPLFSSYVPDVQPSKIENALEDVDPDNLSPKEALDILYKLKALEKK